MQLDRNKKIVLMKALSDGFIDDEAIKGWFECGLLTDEAIEEELTRVETAMYPKTCQRLKRAGLCVDCNRSGGVVNGVRLSKDIEEIQDYHRG